MAKVALTKGGKTVYVITPGEGLNRHQLRAADNIMDSMGYIANGHEITLDEYGDPVPDEINEMTPDSSH